jgi:glycosyltransferase involved in cell wall biosynthesis
VNVTVVIPTIPPRKSLLARAFTSVERQILRPTETFVEIDLGRSGAAATRQRGLERAETEWVAFLDDDDVMYPFHLDTLARAAEATGADLVYPWFDLYLNDKPHPNRHDLLRVAGQDPYGRPFDDTAKQWILTRGNFIPVTVLARREALLDAGGFRPPPGRGDCEDWGAWQAMLRAGASFAHVGVKTWRWNHWSGNTSGLPSRW